MWISWILLACALASCGVDDTGASRPSTPIPAAEPERGTLDELATGVRVRGVVEAAHRTASRWGGPVTLLRLEGAGPPRMLVSAEGLEEGATVVLRGTLRVLEMREGEFFSGSSAATQEVEAERPALPVALYLDDARVDDAEGDAVETTADLLQVLRPVRLRGRLRHDVIDERSELRLQLDDQRCVRVLVVAEVVEEFEARAGHTMTLEGGIRPYDEATPSPEEGCWTVPGIALVQPTTIADDAPAE